MSSFSNTPQLLTKDKLKSALKANGIPLPKADQRKAFYVDLYLQKLTSQNEEQSSSDESEELSDSSPMGSSKKLPPKAQQKIVINKRVKGGLPFDVTALSDGDLARQLKSFGATVGPITNSTRPLYQKKLAKFLTEELQAPAAPPAKPSTKQKRTSPPMPQRKENTEFSDGSDVNDASAEELEPEMFERLDYNHDQQDHEDSLPHEILPPPKSTPAKSRPRKRVLTSTLRTQQHTKQVYNESKGETAHSLDQTDSIEIVEVKKSAQPEKEESTICSPHVQILLAVLVFLGFTAFLVYYLMEETPPEITNGNTITKG